MVVAVCFDNVPDTDITDVKHTENIRKIQKTVVAEYLQPLFKDRHH